MDLAPMLASLADAPLSDPDLVYEPKYDGIRAIAEVPPGGPVRLWSRLGNEKTAQFREIADALEAWARKRKEPVVLDGEIVALDPEGRPIGFQHLQGRIHLKKRGRVDFSDEPSEQGGQPSSAYIAFDLLTEGARDLRDLPLTERRTHLERIFAATRSTILRISEQVRGDGRALYARALEQGWEGLIAKHASSRYKSGKRTPDWRKLKILNEQEFVVGGWTEPRQTRANFGALILGVYEEAAARPQNRKSPRARPKARQAATDRGNAPLDLVYIGHLGTGFNEKELARVMALLGPIETKTSPFRDPPPGNETPHWVKPRLVVQVKFTEWTADGHLRHPVYLGLRDDKNPKDVRREVKRRLHETARTRLEPRPAAAAGATSPRPGGKSAADAGTFDPAPILEQLHALEDARRDGTIDLPGGDRLAVTNLHKVFWPAQKITKGGLLRFYAQIAPFILPAVADRPLVMKRFPNGIAGQPFYQHRATDVPPGVRVEMVKAAEGRPQMVGGDIKTLLYMTQLAAISQDPWFSRFQTPESADHTAIDLDPMPGVPFAAVLDVARWIRDELQTLQITGVPKTSGADGLHIYIPLPPGTPYEAGLIFCQIVATIVCNAHPKQATVERAVRARGKRVYVDCLQNILGKTLATAYSARASDYAGVSTPLTWKEVDEGVRREEFTIQSMPGRVKKVGDLWATLRTAKPADLSRVARYASGKTKA